MANSKRRASYGSTMRFTIIERVDIEGDIEMRREAYDWLDEHGFRVTRCGPYTSGKLWPNVDANRFMITAERDL